MRVSQDAQGKLFSSSDERLTRYFCQNLAVLVENVQLFEKLQLDGNHLAIRLADARKQLKQLSLPLTKDINTILERLGGLVSADTTVRCFKFGGKCAKGKIEAENKAFIGMPFGPPYYKNLYRFAIEPGVREAGVTPWIASQERGVRDLMCKVCEGIQISMIGVIDISEWNANVLFELGLLYGLGRPVILLKREDATVPIDLAGLEYLEYGDFEELRQALSAQICKLMPRRD
jgi:hypothetical protein